MCGYTHLFMLWCLFRADFGAAQRESNMTNLTNRKVIWFKGGLFVALGLLASSLLLARTPELTSALLLGITVWAFCQKRGIPSSEKKVVNCTVNNCFQQKDLATIILYCTTTSHPPKLSRYRILWMLVPMWPSTNNFHTAV